MKWTRPEAEMKLQLLVIGCCFALAVSKPAEDACAAMRARLLPSLEPSARADAGALRACDADSDGAVDAAELVSCVQRAFGSTAHMDRAEVGERIHCFRSIMMGTALRGEQRQMIDTQQIRQLGSGSGSVSGLDCGGQNQLEQILVAIADGQLQAAYDALIDWYVDTISQSTGLLNGLLNNVSFILQFLLTGRSSESLVYMLTAFVRSADNALTAPVEDALISSLLAVSVGNLAAARIIIELRLNAEVLNPATQDELQWIIEAFDAGSTADTVTRIISLLAGCTTSGAQSDDSIYVQLLAVYDQFSQNPGDGEELFFAIWERSQKRQPPLSDEIMNTLNEIAKAYRDGWDGFARITLTTFLNSPCGYDHDFSGFLVNFMFFFNEGDRENAAGALASAIEGFDDPIYEEAGKQLQAVIDDIENSNFDRVREGIRKVVVTCVEKAEMTEE